jgi:hypothetical protein
MGSMFGSQDHFHGIEPPFHPELTWEFMFCPYSRRTHWPFLNEGSEPKRLLTDMGIIEIPGPATAVKPIPMDHPPTTGGHVCTQCNKEFETARKLNSHSAVHKKGNK